MKENAVSGEKGKIMALESLRGLAAFTVVLHHFFTSFYPATALDNQVSHSLYERVLASSPLFLVVNGPFAVIIFFVLSGFVLSVGYYRRRSDLLALAVKRYFRLVPIVFVSVMLSYVLFTLGLFFAHQAGGLAQSPYLEQFWPTSDINLLGALWQAVAGTFAVQSTGASLNPVLWTLFYELSGSFIVFSLLALLGTDKRRWYVYLFVVISFVSTWYIGFIIGLILADIYCNRRDIFDFIEHIPSIYKFVALMIAVYVASMPYMRSFETIGVLYKPLIFISNYPLNVNIMYLLAATIMVTLLLSSRRLSWLFELRPLVFLGKISYSLYAVHFLVLGSVGSLIFIHLFSRLPYNLAAAITGGVYLVVTVLLAVAFQRYIDQAVDQAQPVGRT